MNHEKKKAVFLKLFGHKFITFILLAAAGFLSRYLSGPLP